VAIAASDPQRGEDRRKGETPPEDIPASGSRLRKRLTLSLDATPSLAVFPKKYTSEGSASAYTCDDIFVRGITGSLFRIHPRPLG